jgi:hypothetical protein
LLTGIVVCADDGERMVGHKAKYDGYECVRCQRRIRAERLDALVTETVLAKLSTPRLVKRLARARSDRGEAEALQELDRTDARLAEIAADYGSGELDRDEYRAARSAAQARRKDAERRLASRRGSRVLSDALTLTDDIRGIWEQQGIPWRRELIRAVVERIEVGASTRPVWQPSRITVSWRA